MSAKNTLLYDKMIARMLFDKEWPQAALIAATLETDELLARSLDKSTNELGRGDLLPSRHSCATGAPSHALPLPDRTYAQVAKGVRNLGKPVGSCAELVTPTFPYYGRFSVLAGDVIDDGPESSTVPPVQPSIHTSLQEARRYLVDGSDHFSNSETRTGRGPCCTGGGGSVGGSHNSLWCGRGHPRQASVAKGVSSAPNSSGQG